MCSECGKSNRVRYKSYTGIYGFDHETRLFKGRVQGLSFPFYGISHGEMTETFQSLIDDYLAFYRETGATPPGRFDGNMETFA